MEDFLAAYFAVAVLMIILNLLFWGGVIYLVWRFVRRAGTPAERTQRLGLAAKVLTALFGARTRDEFGPKSTEAADTLANGGIDPYRK